MRSCAAVTLVLMLLLFGIPWLAEAPEGGQAPSEPLAAEEQRADADIALTVWDGQELRQMTMAEYLPGVVRGEMPAAFSQQALDAQAVAERTFICYHMAGGRKDAHPEADVCTSPACCSAYVSQEDAAARWGDKAEERANLWLGYIAAVLLHGFYDSCAMINTVASSLIFIAFVVIMYIVVIKKVNKESQNDGPIT